MRNLEYCNGSTEAAGAYLALLVALRDKTGIFGNQIRWAAALKMHPKQWWTLWEEDLPEMAELCMRALSILPTSGDAESRSSREKYNETAERVFRWVFDRVIPCHGDVIRSGGRGEFAVLFMDHLHPEYRGMESKRKEA